MPIGARNILGAIVLSSLAAGLSPAWAQGATGSSTWSDPPARAAAPVQPAPAMRNEAPVAEQPVASAKAIDGPAAGPRIGMEAPRAGRTRRTVTRRASEAMAARTKNPHEARREREAKKTVRTPVLVQVPSRPRGHSSAMAARRVQTQHRPAVTRHAGTDFVESRGYGFGRPAPLPVGRVEGQVDGERVGAFGDDRARRLAAEGYLVVRSHTVRFPDGRVLRTYRPYEDDEVD